MTSRIQQQGHFLRDRFRPISPDLGRHALRRASFVIGHDVNDFPPRDREGWCRLAGIEDIMAENVQRQVVRLDPEELPQTKLPDGRVRHQRQGR